MISSNFYKSAVPELDPQGNLVISEKINPATIALITIVALGVINHVFNRLEEAEQNKKDELYEFINTIGDKQYYGGYDSIVDPKPIEVANKTASVKQLNEFLDARRQFLFLNALHDAVELNVNEWKKNLKDDDFGKFRTLPRLRVLFKKDIKKPAATFKEYTEQEYDREARFSPFIGYEHSLSSFHESVRSALPDIEAKLKGIEKPDLMGKTLEEYKRMVEEYKRQLFDLDIDLGEVTELRLKCCNLDALPKMLYDCKNLRELNLSDQPNLVGFDAEAFSGLTYLDDAN